MVVAMLRMGGSMEVDMGMDMEELESSGMDGTRGVGMERRQEGDGDDW